MRIVYVEIEFYNDTEQQVAHEVYELCRWYEELHPLVDLPAARTRLGIVRMEGRRYSEAGEIEMRWRLTYKHNGDLLEEWVWEKDGSTRHTRF